MSDIPKPTADDLASDLAVWYARTEEYGRCPSKWFECAARRAVAAEAEAERLKAIRLWVIDRIKHDVHTLSAQVLLRELVHLLDGLPLPKVRNSQGEDD